jgi:uncharacterized membrane protein
MKKLTLASIILIILLIAVNIYFYNALPGYMITHWDSHGEPNGMTSKFWALSIIPFLTIVIFLLFISIPKIDPLKRNYAKFIKYYDSFILIFIIFMVYINFITLLINLNSNLKINNFIIPAIGILFIYMGIILKNIKRNWFIGIRTPWTISSDKVWDKTHILGSKLFIISGTISIIGIFFNKYLLWFVLVPIIVSAIWLVIYSYLEYRKEENSLNSKRTTQK